MVTTKKNNKKIIDCYLNLPWSYTIETIKENGQTLYIVCVNEMSGICTDGQTIDAAMELIKEAMVATFEFYLENNEEIKLQYDKK